MAAGTETKCLTKCLTDHSALTLRFKSHRAIDLIGIGPPAMSKKPAMTHEPFLERIRCVICRFFPRSDRSRPKNPADGGRHSRRPLMLSGLLWFLSAVVWTSLSIALLDAFNYSAFPSGTWITASDYGPHFDGGLDVVPLLFVPIGAAYSWIQLGSILRAAMRPRAFRRRYTAE